MVVTPRLSGLLLAPGASAGREQPALVAIDEAVSALGLVVDRIDFPYHLAGRRRPDPPAVLIETVAAAARSLAARSPANHRLVGQRTHRNAAPPLMDGRTANCRSP